MNSNEFVCIRKFLGKSQSQMARLLAISPRAVQSFEQGWRRITQSVEKNVLLLLSLRVNSYDEIKPCWEIRNCPDEWKAKCPAWEFKAGHLCWFINGTFCNGKPQDNWKRKMELCHKCEAFQRLKVPTNG